jgi:hypothetical protein
MILVWCTVLWDVMPQSLVIRFQHFGRYGLNTEAAGPSETPVPLYQLLDISILRDHNLQSHCLSSCLPSLRFFLHANVVAVFCMFPRNGSERFAELFAVTDIPSEDMLTHFEHTSEFIRTGQEQGAVLVHW